MRPSDEHDDVAERIVFDDERCRALIADGNDGELALRISEILREHYDPASHTPLSGRPGSGPNGITLNVQARAGQRSK